MVLKVMVPNTRTVVDLDIYIYIYEFFQVLLLSCKVMAPFTPFFTEALYQNMRKVCNGSEESIHYCSFPKEEGKVRLNHLIYFKSYNWSY